MIQYSKLSKAELITIISNHMANRIIKFFKNITKQKIAT